MNNSDVNAWMKIVRPQMKECDQLKYDTMKKLLITKNLKNNLHGQNTYFTNKLQ